MRAQLRYMMQRVGAFAAYFNWWRSGLVVAAVASALAGVLVGPAALWVVVAAVPLIVLVGVLGARAATNHTAVQGLDTRLVAVERRVAQLGSAEPGSAAKAAAGQDAVIDEARRILGAARGRLAAESAGVSGVRLPRSAPSPAAPEGEALVTVVVPCFNDARFLEPCLESVRRQTFADWRCIVVDDASLDESAVVATAAAAADSRFQLVRHTRNGGLSAARNTGLRLARSPLVTFLDADDLLYPHSLADRVEAMTAVTDDSVAGVFCGVRTAPEEIELDQLGDAPPWSAPPFHDFLTARGECPFNAHAPLLRTEILRRAGGFDESMRGGAEDWDLWLRVMRNGYWFLPSRQVGAVYREKRISMVRRMPSRHLEAAARLLESVHLPMAGGEIVPGAPYPFRQPIGYYERLVLLAKRVLSFGAMAAMTGDAAEIDRSLGLLEPASLPILERHVDLDAEIDMGIRRALCIDPAALRALEADVAPLRDAVRAAVRRVARSEPPDPPRPQEDRAHRVLCLPQNAAQARRMAALAGEIGAQLVESDRVTGDQGAADTLDRLGVPYQSLNQLALSGRGHQTLVVALPYGAVAAEAVAATRKEGGRVVEVDSGSDVLDCNRLYDPGEARPGWDGVAAAIGAADLDDVPAARLADVFVGNGSEAADSLAVEEYPHLPFDGDAMQAFRDKHRGERCVIIGNGPSLNDLDLTKLSDERTFGVNGIFYAADRMGFDPTYYVVEDTSVMRENTARIIAYQAGHKFFPSLYRSLVGERSGVTYFMMNRGFYEKSSPHFCVPRFSTDAARRLFSGQSVTHINLQLAYYMGFTEVVLIGMDFSYVIPSDAERAGDIITSGSDDPNHFHKDYFGKGKTWKDPKLDRVLANYQIAKAMFEEDGRRIVNATAGGKLELFDRVDYDSLF